MTTLSDHHRIASVEQLESLFGAAAGNSLLKVTDHVHAAYRSMIEQSPFAILATAGPRGLDTSPRGDPAGFVVVQDEKTLLLPERRGNNRIDSLRNILVDPRVALLFLIPGVDECLRVQGRAYISTDPDAMARTAMAGKAPQCVIVIEVDTVFFQCGRAILRAGLWDSLPEAFERPVPTPGAILAALADVDGEAYDRALPARVASTLY